MSTAKHTHGPLVACVDDGEDEALTIFKATQLNDGRIDPDDWDFYVAQVGHNHPDRQEIARRLVACWNACEQIETAELEDIASSGGILGLCKDVLRVSEQRDELINALKQARELSNSSAAQLFDMAELDYTGHAVRDAKAAVVHLRCLNELVRAAIAKATGETA